MYVSVYMIVYVYMSRGFMKFQLYGPVLNHPKRSHEGWSKSESAESHLWLGISEFLGALDAQEG